MRVALVADFHGNWPAVQALEKDLAAQGPDRVICLGDIVGKGPSSPQTFDWAMAHCDLVLGGNWDYGIGYRRFPKDDYYWAQLGEARLQALRELPQESHLTLGGRSIRLFHGRPVMESLVTIRNEKGSILPFFSDDKGNPFDVVAYGDAHRQALRTMTPGLFINCGSVGNALGEPRCCYALLEGDAHARSGEGTAFEVRFRQVDYDRAQAILDAQNAPQVPRVETYIRELQTGEYSR